MIQVSVVSVFYCNSGKFCSLGEWISNSILNSQYETKTSLYESQQPIKKESRYKTLIDNEKKFSTKVSVISKMGNVTRFLIISLLMTCKNTASHYWGYMKYTLTRYQRRQNVVMGKNSLPILFCSVLEQLGAGMCDIFQTFCQTRKDISQITNNNLSIVIQQPCSTPVYWKALCMNSSKEPFTHTIRTPHFHISKFPFSSVFAICTTCSCSFEKAPKHFHKH